MNIDQMLQTFILESRDQLDAMEAALLAIESDAVDAETVHALFRSAHTIKGSAGLFQLDTRAEHWQRLSEQARAATITVLNRQAARIAEHPADVICDVTGRHVGYVQDADGLAEVGGRRAWLTPDICYRLYLIHRSGHAAGSSSGQAIAVLAHEAWHLHGEASEARANCFAYQSGVQVGEALGLTASTARQLMREQLDDNPVDFAETPQYIVPSGCQRGGSLDLQLDGTHFP